MAQRPTEQDLRQNVLEAAQTMGRIGLTPGKSGNVSARTEDGFVITPSGMPYAALTSVDMVVVPFAGAMPRGQRTPSSESPMHAAIYAARPDVGAVVHTHSRHATALACLGEPIPAFHYMVAVAGAAEIPCVPYATFGSEALSRHVAHGLAAVNACLLAHHGVVTVGADCHAALDLAREVETLAALYTTVLAIRRPDILSKPEMQHVLANFKTYGQAKPVRSAPKTKPAAAGRGSR